MLHRLPAQVILRIFTHLANFNTCSALLLTSGKFQFIYHQSKPLILCSIARNYVHEHPGVVSLTVENPFGDGLEDFELELEEELDRWGRERTFDARYPKENCDLNAEAMTCDKGNENGERRLQPWDIKDATKLAARARTALIHKCYFVHFNMGPIADEEASIKFQNAIFLMWKLCIQSGNRNLLVTPRGRGPAVLKTSRVLSGISDDELEELSKALLYLRRLVTELMKRISPDSSVSHKYGSCPQTLQRLLLSFGPGILLTIYETSDPEIRENLLLQQIEKAQNSGSGVSKFVEEIGVELAKRRLRYGSIMVKGGTSNDL
ncbi:hypothetical protein RUND412_008312 [Rhizina undulata]